MAELPPAYITNERWKSVSRTAFQLGSALLAAALVKSYGVGTITSETSLWIFMSLVVIWGGWTVLGLLESER